MSTITETYVKVAVRIGHGTRIHRGFATRVTTDAGKPWQSVRYTQLQLSCSCPGSQSGAATNKAHIVSTDGWDQCNCGR